MCRNGCSVITYSIDGVSAKLLFRLTAFWIQISASSTILNSSRVERKIAPGHRLTALFKSIETKGLVVLLLKFLGGNLWLKSSSECITRCFSAFTEFYSVSRNSNRIPGLRLTYSLPSTTLEGSDRTSGGHGNGGLLLPHSLKDILKDLPSIKSYWKFL